MPLPLSHVHIALGSNAVGNAWLPDVVSNLIFWYDATYISTLFQDSTKLVPVSSNNDPVGAWECRAGVGPDLIQATTANKPTYKTNIQSSKPGIYFTTDDFFSAALGWQDTIIFAIKNYVIGTNIIGDNALARHVKGQSSASIRWIANSIATINDPTGTRVWSCYQTATDKVVRFNGSEEGSLASTNTIGFDYVGRDSGGGYLEGYLLEMFAYSVTPSVADIVLAENYLNAKWSIY